MTTTVDRPEVGPASGEGIDPAAAPPASPQLPRYRSDPGPWRRRDGLLAGLLGAAGTAGLIVCWFGVSDEVVWREQIPWAIGGVLCTAVVVVAGALYLLRGLRCVRQGFRDLRRDQRVLLGLPRVSPSAGAAAAPATTSDVTGPVSSVTYVSAPEMTRAHRPDCLLMRGKQATPVPAAEVDRYPRCGVCEP